MLMSYANDYAFDDRHLRARERASGVTHAVGPPAPGGAPLSIRDVAVRYGAADREAVAGVSLEVAAGSLVVLLGPSGCGKSTLLRTINRLVTPGSGTVLVDGRDVSRIDAVQLRRGIGYVIQEIGLFPHMTVAANIAIVPQLLGINEL